jgi:hypothetical protein
MLPFMLPIWETDVTVRAAIEQSVQASATSLGSGAVLPGGELDVDAKAAGPRAFYTAALHAEYARAFDVALGGGAGSPTGDLDADASLDGTWTLSPWTTLSLTAQSSLATTDGMRADTQLIELDPFLFGWRLEYAAGGDLSLSLDPWQRAGITVEAGYLQAGALAADSPTAVGVDTHEGHADASYSWDLGPHDTLTPELLYTYTHYYDALLGPARGTAPHSGDDGTDFRRGAADIHTVALTASASHEIARGFRGTATAGASVGTPMPLLGWQSRSRSAVIAPDARLSLRWTGRRARVNARYAYTYTSLGPRIGYGQQHSVTIRLDVRPREGARYRDLALRGTLRFAHGAAPLAGDEATLHVPGMPPPLPASGTLTTTTLAAGTRVDVPLVRGLAFTAGVDLRVVRGTLDAPPVRSATQSEIRGIFTLGLAATVSTDKNRTVTRDPEAEQEDAARRALGPGGAEERFEDRSHGDDERETPEDAVDRGWPREP